MSTIAQYHAELDALLGRLAGIEAAIAAADGIGADALAFELSLDADDVRDAMADLADRTADAPDTEEWNAWRWRITDVVRAQRDAVLATFTAALAKAHAAETRRGA